ncbi:MAG: PQQ-dependent sugar dehydrogenase [Planctomycetota bacterium]
MDHLFKLQAVPAALCLALVGGSPAVVAQDILGDTLSFSGATLDLRAYSDPPVNSLISMTTAPRNSGINDLFATTQTGIIFRIAPDGNGGSTTTPWFNYNTAVNQSIGNALNGFVLEDPNGVHGGLRSVAFHPEFATNGKFYTSAMVDRPSGSAANGLNYLGNSTSGFDGESVLAEWTVNLETGFVDNTSYRELFRVQMPVFDHPIKQIAFNPYSAPGDEDYGLLYVTHGDGSVQSATAGGGQNRDDALGKVLRVDPLQNGSAPYSTPNNPFLDDPSTLDEVFTLGHRNPHHIGFGQDDQSNSYAIVAEPGRDNIEEVNVLQAGGDYGWSDREGTFVHNNNGGPFGNGYGLGYGVQNLPFNDAALNDYIYPAAQYDHDANPGQGFVGSAIGGGFVIDNGSDPELDGQYIFADFGSFNGYAMHASLDDLLGAHTQLEDGQLPSALTQAEISRLQLTLDDDGDGNIDRVANDFNSLFQESRNDVRFGRGPNGELFISSKRTGEIYLVTNTVLEGDYNGDGFVSQGDLNMILLNWGAGVTPDGWYSYDAFDGNISQNELNDVLLNWGSGRAPVTSVAAIPEPHSVLLLSLGSLLTVARRRTRTRA